MNINKINTTTNFGAKTKEGYEYKKTNFFKISGAAISTGLYAATLGVVHKQANPEVLKEFKLGQKVGLGVIAAGLGALGGWGADIMINKTVKNVVRSLKGEPSEKK